MLVAVCYEDGRICQHFGRTEEFKIYQIENNEIIDSQIIGTEGYSHCGLAEYLGNLHVDALICGGIGPGAQLGLMENGVAVFGGIDDDADEAVKKLINKTLDFNPNPTCNHEDGEDCHDDDCHHMN